MTVLAMGVPGGGAVLPCPAPPGLTTSDELTLEVDGRSIWVESWLDLQAR